MEVLDRDFYLSSDVLNIAKSLLGKVLITSINGAITSGMIVETEAYRAPEDKASHAYQNRRTKRTETMFQKGGIAYVYLCYGIHHMFNVVTAQEGIAHAVLIRAIEPMDGAELMSERRSMSSTKRSLTNGTGKLSPALGITTNLDGQSLYKEGGLIKIADYKRIAEADIVSGPRVGVAYAQEAAHWPWRYRIKDNPWSSKPDIVKYPKTALSG